jgi:hypothetical protein
MYHEFIELLNKKRKKYEFLFEKRNDEYLYKFKAKFLNFKIEEPILNNDEDFNIDDNIVTKGNIQNRITNSDNTEQKNEFDSTILEIKESYLQLSKDINRLKAQIFNVLNRKMRLWIQRLVNNFLVTLIDTKNASFYGYIMYQYQDMPHIFSDVDYRINVVDDEKTNNLIIEIMIDANVAYKYHRQIENLLKKMVEENLVDGGNLCLYLFFAPWEEKFTPIISLLYSYFKEIELFYPLCMLTISNYMIYICRNKQPIISSKQISHRIFEKMIHFSKKITYYALYTFGLISYMVIASINKSSVFDIMINKIISYFEKLPDYYTFIS